MVHSAVAACRCTRFPQTSSTTAPATSLDEVLHNVTHRSAGTGGVDTLTNAADRAKIVRFLLSIDAATAADPVVLSDFCARVARCFYAAGCVSRGVREGEGGGGGMTTPQVMIIFIAASTVI